MESHKNKSRRSVEIGLDEKGMKQDFIKLYKVLATDIDGLNVTTFNIIVANLDYYREIIVNKVEDKVCVISM